MKVYLDTTIITLLLFGQKRNPERFAEVKQLFDAIDDGQVAAVISIYALQELCSFCYANFPTEDAPTVTRLAFYELLAHELLLTPLLSRTDRIVLSRRFPIRDASDQAHAGVAHREGCSYIITYDSHFQDIADLLPSLTAGELLNRLGKD